METASLRRLLTVFSTDIAFALLTRVRSIDAFLQRREPIYDAIVRDAAGTGLVSHAYVTDDADLILADLVRHASAITVPWFVPMREAIESGFSFEKEPRLLGILPIGTKNARDKLLREATFAARVFRWVSASDGVISKEEQRMILLFFAAIGMPNEFAEPLLREPPAPSLSAIEKPADIDAHVAEAIVRGAHGVAEQDGLDEREDAAVRELALYLGVPESFTASLNPSYPPPPPRIDPDAPADSTAAPPGSDPRDSLRKDPTHRAYRDQLRLAYALVDCVRYLSNTFGESTKLATSVRVCFRAVAPIYAQNDLELRCLGGGPSPFAQPHALSPREVPSVLAAAWALWLQSNPTLLDQTILQERLHRVSHLLTQDDRASTEALSIVGPRVQKLLQRGVLASGF